MSRRLLSRSTYAPLVSSITSIAWKGLGVLFLAAASVVLLVAAAMAMALIQFQLRLQEAKIQNAGFSLSSVIQAAKVEQQVETNVRLLRDKHDVAFRYIQTAVNYANVLNYGLQEICTQMVITSNAEKNPKTLLTQLEINKEAAPCIVALSSFLRSSSLRSLDPAGIQNIITMRLQSPKPIDNAYLTSMINSTAVQIHHYENLTDNLLKREVKLQSDLDQYQRNCGQIQQFLGLLPVSLSTGNQEFYKYLFFSLNCQDIIALYPNPIVSPEVTSSYQTRKTDDQKSDESGVNRILLAELISYYRFYGHMFDRMIDPVVSSPIDFSFSILVIFAGLLGAFLRVIFDLVQSSKDGRTMKIRADVFFMRLVLSVMCALIIYILSRTTLVTFVDRAQTSGGVNLNPYFVAFLAVVSGILAEEAFAKITSVGQRMLSPGEETVKTSS